MVRCGSCGRESPEGYKFCETCGSILATPIDLHDTRLDSSRQMVARAIYERSRTDRQLSPLWIALIILVNIVNVLVIVLLALWSLDGSSPFVATDSSSYIALNTVSSLIGLLSMLVLAWFIYYLVKRQNDHYAREANLRTALVSLIRAAAWSPERMYDIAPEMMALSTVERRQEQPRIVWFWVFVVLFPSIASIALSASIQMSVSSDSSWQSFDDVTIVILLVSLVVALVSLILTLYLLYFLTQTMLEHDGRWNVFAFNSRRAMSKLGFPPGRPYRMSRLPDRSMVLYIILTIFTGVFVLYWLYVLAKDPNEHFMYQWEFEDNAMSAITPSEYSATSSVSRR